MEPRSESFARELYFDLQTIEGVKPLEMWSAFRDLRDPFEASLLVKNLYKMVVPLANERCYGLPFAEHAQVARKAVSAVIAWFTEDLGGRLLDRFPWPPTGEGDQKALYRLVRGRAAELLAAPASLAPAAGAGAGPGTSTEALFDFREMRLVDNELPFIIFTDKEFRVIHGMAIVYLWLIDLDGLVLGTLEELGVEPGLREEYAAFARRVRREGPLAIAGKQVDVADLVERIGEKLRQENYLDIFESVYAWYEQARQKHLK